MDKVKFNDGEEAKQEDYTNAQRLAEKALQDALYEMYGRVSGFIQGGFKVTAGTGMTLSMAAGRGLIYDASEVDPDAAAYKPISNPAAAAVVVPVADSTDPRIDIVCVAQARDVGEPETRLYMDADTEEITEQSLDKRDRDYYALQYVEGSPDPSPVAPSVPAGYTLIATIDVAAGATSIVNGDITDERYSLPIIQAPGPRAVSMFCTGPLAAMIGLDVDHAAIPENLVITAISIMCPLTPDTGTIEIDILLQENPGDTPTSIFSIQPRPTLDANGGAAWIRLQDPDLPDVTAFPAGSLLSLQLVDAPTGAYDLKVDLY